MSGILGQLLGAVGGQQEGQSNAIADILQQILTQNGGGVAALISRFENAGLGNHAQSWVNGDHQPITGNQIDQVFSPEEIKGWASQLGTDPDKMRGVLAEALPHAVDHATPNGQIPTQSTVPDLSSLINQFFQR
jgi:uncharacterized protein YidB (DUF937 family)